MVKQTITYTDYFGKTRTEDFYFNLTKMELTEMMVSVDGDMETILQNMVNSKNYKDLLQTFNTFVSMAYGERSEDGRYFNKSDEIRNHFLHSAAYDELCNEIFYKEGGTELALNLMIRALPQEIQGKVGPSFAKKVISEAKKKNLSVVDDG